MSNEVLGPCEKGLVFVISAPAGAGKTTLAKKLIEEFSDIVLNVSFTTRKPRPGEIHGVDYYFVEEEEFLSMAQKGAFLENVELFHHRYAVSKEHVEAKRQAQKHVLLVIDTQGAMTLMGQLDATFIFIKPPSKEELARRMYGRASESKEHIEERLSWSEHELSVAHLYDYQIINDELSRAYEVIRSIVIAETHRTNKGKKDATRTSL